MNDDRGSISCRCWHICRTNQTGSKIYFNHNFTTTGTIFNDYFILQCTTIDTGSEIPNIATSNAPALVNIHITEEKILKIICSLNPNKAHGLDEISVRMIKISDDVLVAPLKMIFESCIQNGIFPEIWKMSNIVPVHKKQ